MKYMTDHFRASWYYLGIGMSISPLIIILLIPLTWNEGITVYMVGAIGMLIAFATMLEDKLLIRKWKKQREFAEWCVAEAVRKQEEHLNAIRGTATETKDNERQGE